MAHHLTAEEARKLLDYDPATGFFRWRVDCRRARSGTIAGCNHSKGYIKIRSQGRVYLAHRLAWLITHGVMPKGEIDHINGLKNDNRIANLRDVSRRQNAQNLEHHRSGRLAGALKCTNGKWVARAIFDGKLCHLGTFESEVEAHRAYVSATAEVAA